MNKMTITRVPGAQRIECISEGQITLDLSGDGPWELTADEWAILVRLHVDDNFHAADAADQE